MANVIMRHGHLMQRGMISAVILCNLTACQKQPEGVLNAEEMASLMADIHLGEAVIDYNYSEFPNDSTRKILKQSIYLAHGVDAATVDTSFVWYGNHIEEYIKVYDRTIEIIQDRQRDYASAANAQIAIAGDSVEVWNGPRHIVVNASLPSNIVTFAITPDSTWQNGDGYMLRYKPINTQVQIKSKLLVDYSNGTTHYVDASFLDKNNHSIKLPLDSTLTPLRVYGYLEVPAQATGYFELDSIALIRIRKHLLRQTYMPKRVFQNGINQTDIAAPDSVSNPTYTENGSTEKNQGSRINQNISIHHRQPAKISDMPESSGNSGRQTEHRMTAGQHKVDRATNAATKLRANNHQLMQRQSASKESNTAK